MADLTTLANVKQWLATDGQPYPLTDDALLSLLISGVSTAIESWLNRDILSASYIYTGNGNGSYRLLLPNYPVTAVSSVTLDGVAVLPSAGYGLTGFNFDEKGLWMVGDTWHRGVQNVSVSYTAGYATVPLDLERACLSTIAMRYRERERVGMASKAIQGETTAFIVKDFPADAMTVLNQYRKVVPI